DWELFLRHGNFRYGGTIHDVIVDSGPFAPGSAFAKG
ncbi:MAG: hypothetical protein RJA10_4027, partial [Pseudomonadota bacterium]